MKQITERSIQRNNFPGSVACFSYFRNPLVPHNLVAGFCVSVRGRIHFAKLCQRKPFSRSIQLSKQNRPTPIWRRLGNEQSRTEKKAYMISVVYSPCISRQPCFVSQKVEYFTSGLPTRKFWTRFLQVEERNVYLPATKQREYSEPQYFSFEWSKSRGKSGTNGPRPRPLLVAFLACIDSGESDYAGLSDLVFQTALLQIQWRAKRQVLGESKERKPWSGKTCPPLENKRIGSSVKIVISRKEVKSESGFEALQNRMHYFVCFPSSKTKSPVFWHEGKAFRKLRSVCCTCWAVVVTLAGCWQASAVEDCQNEQWV